MQHYFFILIGQFLIFRAVLYGRIDESVISWFSKKWWVVFGLVNAGVAIIYFTN
jgi:hypothetical protein